MSAITKFVSERTAEEIALYRHRATQLAANHFTQQETDSIDLGEVPTYGYVHAVISTSYVSTQNRIRFVTENNSTLFTARFSIEGGVLILKSFAAWVHRVNHVRGAEYVRFEDVQQFADQYFTYLKRGEVGDMWGIKQEQHNFDERLAAARAKKQPQREAV